MSIQSDSGGAFIATQVSGAWKLRWGCHETCNFFLTYTHCYIYFLPILFLAMQGLHRCLLAFSNCRDRGLFCSCRECGLLIAVASLIAEHRLWARWFTSCHARLSYCVACGIFPDQGSNSCPLHWPGGFLSTVPPGKSTHVIPNLLAKGKMNYNLKKTSLLTNFSYNSQE